jgi:hypothetical protein
MILDLGPSEFWGSWCAVGRPISTDILTFNGERRTKNRSVQSLSPGAGVWTGWRLSDSVLYLFSSPYLDMLGVSTIYQPLLSPNPSTSKPQERFVEDLKMLSMFGDLNRNGSFLESRALDGRNNSLSFFFEKDWIYQTGLIIPHHLINANQPDHTRPLFGRRCSVYLSVPGSKPTSVSLNQYSINIHMADFTTFFHSLYHNFSMWNQMDGPHDDRACF